jgi:hypothetical protein
MYVISTWHHHGEMMDGWILDGIEEFQDQSILEVECVVFCIPLVSLIMYLHELWYTCYFTSNFSKFQGLNKSSSLLLDFLFLLLCILITCGDFFSRTSCERSLDIDLIWPGPGRWCRVRQTWWKGVLIIKTSNGLVSPNMHCMQRLVFQ